MGRRQRIGVVLGLGIVSLLGAGPWRSHALAQEVVPGAIPRTLRGGAPVHRLPQRGAPKPQAQPRSKPAPAVTVDRSRPHAAGLERRSAALLQREIALLQRLVAHTPRTHPQRADALMRLAIAYQELIWLQKVELHRLEARRARCRARPRESRPTSCIARIPNETRENPPS